MARSHNHTKAATLLARGREPSVELVDVISDEPPRARDNAVDTVRGGSALPRWSWLVIATAAVLIGGVVVQGRGHSGSAGPARPTAASAVATPTTAARFAASAPVVVTNTGRPLLAVPAHWDLFGQGSGVVVRVQLAQGRVTTTRLPVPSASPVALIPLPGRVIVRPLIYGAGCVVPDDEAATRLGGRLGQAGPALVGPEPGQVWVRTSPAAQDATRLTLVELGDRTVGASVDVPGDGYLVDDGTGHVAYANRVNNEAYLTSPGRWRFHTPGQLLAAGADKVVTIERNGPGRYSTVLTDVMRGRRRVWAARGLQPNPVLGPVAPDGRTAAILTSASTATKLHLLDLTTGVSRDPGVALAGNAESVAWSPDGLRLFAVTDSGHVVVIDVRTAAVHRLEMSVPPLTQLVLRP